MKTSSRIAWIILILVAIAHLYRAIAQLDLVVGTYAVPMSISWIAFAVLVVVTLGMWRESKN